MMMVMRFDPFNDRFENFEAAQLYTIAPISPAKNKGHMVSVRPVSATAD